LSKYDQNLNSFNSKKYIDNVKKVTAMFSKADTLIQGTPVSKLPDVGNESQEILINKASQKLRLNIESALKLKKVNNEGDGLDNRVPCKEKEIYIYPSNQRVYRVKKNILPQNSINVCIKCINNYSNKYLAKLLEVSHINPKHIDTYIIWDSHDNMIIPRLKTNRILSPGGPMEAPLQSTGWYSRSPRPFGTRGPIIPKEMDIDKGYSYSKKPLFIVKLFNNRVILPLLILFRKLSPHFRYTWSGGTELLIPLGTRKLVPNPARGVGLGISNFKITSPRIASNAGAGLLERTGRNSNDSNIKSSNIHVFKIESVKFLQLLNFKSFFTLFTVGKGELKLLDRLKIQKRIVEGKLWGILNLYLTNNELYSFILGFLKKQAVKDYNLTKCDIIEPDMLSLYEDKINNITHRAIFKILNNEWYDIKWIISFKFDTVFLNEHRDILIMNLKENINHDYLFLNLIKNMFDMEMIGLENNKSMSRYNIFEHDKLSEFLLNIFFCKLDNKVNELKYNYYEKYNKLLWLKFWNLILKDQNSNSQKLARGVITKAKLNFKYIRYIDTFIIGMNGTKSEVNEIREIIDSFLKSELQLNNLHSYIIDIHNDNLKFMNINISSGLFFGNKYKILFQFPKPLIIKALINSGILSNKRIPSPGGPIRAPLQSTGKVYRPPRSKGPGGRWIPICKKNLLKYDLNTIINTYIDINYFILSSFAICHDYFKLNRFLSYYINCSLKLTLQAKLGKKLWNRVIAPITPLKRNSKTYGINNSWKYVWQRSSISLEKRLEQPNLNILLLFRLGLISSKVFKKLYYFRINNKKYLNRKYANGISNYSSNYNINHINWESNINFDFLISNYYDSSIPSTNKSRVVCVAPYGL
jgi:hypothetical protein